jgi:hypothetical protein
MLNHLDAEEKADVDDLAIFYASLRSRTLVGQISGTLAVLAFTFGLQFN